MNNIKKVLSSPAFTLVSMLVAVAMLLFAGIGGARSALQYYSQNYAAQMDIHDIGVSLLENGDVVSHRDYVGRGQVDANNLTTNEQANWDHSSGLDSLDDDNYDPLLDRFKDDYVGEDKEKFTLGRDFKEVLTVQNSGTVDQYVRVSIYKYWLNGEGERDQELRPSMIELKLNGDNVGQGKDWIEDTDARTDERSVYYYTKMLRVGEVTSALTDSFRINPEIDVKVTKEIIKEENGYTTIKLNYDYDEHQFILEAHVDAVQNHHADDAILSAWGRKVTVNNGVLGLSGN